MKFRARALARWEGEGGALAPAAERRTAGDGNAIEPRADASPAIRSTTDAPPV